MHLVTYDEFIKYVTTMGSSSLYSKAEKPKPLLGNVDDDAPEAAAAPAWRATAAGAALSMEAGSRSLPGALFLSARIIPTVY